MLLEIGFTKDDERMKVVSKSTERPKEPTQGQSEGK